MRKRLIELVVLVSLALGAGPVGAAIWQWSTTAGTNGAADPSINWAEGMAPSSVNDSARAMMAALAAWRNDISGVNTTAGTAAAYTLTTSEGVGTTPANGQMIAFLAHVGNSAAATLQVDGGTAFPIWLNGSAVGAASMVTGAPYRVAFNVANSAWLLEAGPSNPYNTALGAIMWSTVATAPNSNFVPPYGQCISTTTYATYWVAMGSPASGACPGGQFAILDMRGRAPVALDTLPGSSAAGRLTSSGTGCGTAMTSVGAVCVNGVEGAAVTLAQAPTGISSSGTITVTVPSGNSVPANSQAGANYNVGSLAGGVNTFPVNTNGSAWTYILTMTGTGQTMTSTNTGGAVRPQVMPTIGLIPYLRIL